MKVKIHKVWSSIVLFPAVWEVLFPIGGFLFNIEYPDKFWNAIDKIGLGVWLSLFFMSVILQIIEANGHHSRNNFWYFRF